MSINNHSMSQLFLRANAENETSHHKKKEEREKKMKQVWRQKERKARITPLPTKTEIYLKVLISLNITAIYLFKKVLLFHSLGISLVGFYSKLQCLSTATDTSQVQLIPFGNSTKSPAAISTDSFAPLGVTFTFPSKRQQVSLDSYVHGNLLGGQPHLFYIRMSHTQRNNFIKERTNMYLKKIQLRVETCILKV